MDGIEQRGREEIEAHQLERLRALLATVVPANRFWTARLEAAGLTDSLESLDQFRARVPLTTKEDVTHDQREHPSAVRPRRDAAGTG